MAKEDDDLLNWANDTSHYSKSQQTTQPAAKPVAPTSKTGAIESLLRGGYSGVSAGFSPGADDNAQQRAWEDNPVAYGLGNAAGTIGTTLATGGISALAKGALAAKTAAAAAPWASRTTELLGNVVAPAVEKIGGMIPKWGAPAAQGATKAYNWEANTPEGSSMLPTGKRNADKTSSLDEVQPNNFDKLRDYLKDMPEEEKRKQAMAMSTTEQGRSMLTGEEDVA